MRFLLTGHTGFKGSWFTLMLSKLGHEIHGQSLSPESESLYNILRINDVVSSEEFIDIRDEGKTAEYFKTVNPDVIVHLAAQSLVSKSYENPLESIEVNTLGTYNVLKASKFVKNLKCLLVITTDKVYRIDGRTTPYSENDSLGYTDPYGTSKALADLMTQTWMNEFPEVPVSIARAGNVIGGGDFSQNRLIPDIYRAIKNNEAIDLRHPEYIRPWQYVLDCLAGYLMQIESSIKNKKSSILNFGPSENDFKEVNYIVNYFKESFPQLNIKVKETQSFKETEILKLDSNLAMKSLSWKNKFNIQATLEITSNWYRKYLENENMQKLCEIELDNFLTS